MPGPVWDDDDPADAARIRRNIASLLDSIVAAAPARALPTTSDPRGWHAALYAGCSVPIADYVGHFRGDPAVSDLVGYEVGVGPLEPDGYPERMGLWSAEVVPAVQQLMTQIRAAVASLDRVLPAGKRPATVDELSTVVGLMARIHGEWVRIHPFANGNGRTARVWTAWIATRYDLPTFVTLKPRPGDTAYALAARASMGRPPLFQGDHGPAELVFTHMLALALLP